MKVVNAEKLKERILKWNQDRFSKEMIEALIEEIDSETTVLEGRIKKAKYVHKQFTAVKPVEHHYEDLGEPPYIKYGCPVCESLGNRFSFPPHTKNCPLCNVNLLWNEEEFEEDDE